MEKANLIFQCEYCHETFEEPMGESSEPVDPEHIGRYTHIVSTHKCTEDGSIHGCAKLIGIRTEPMEEGRHGGG